jgi:hypothetical protein
VITRIVILGWVAVACCWGAVDFKSASIVVAANAGPAEKTAAAMLTEEIEKRTQLRLRTVNIVPPEGTAFVIRTAPGKAEGFSVEASGHTAVVTGSDARGVIFGTGYLLRQLHMQKQRLELAEEFRVTSAPVLGIRGHQLGYRPKTNSYDGWTVAMWEQYIRELAIFGTNTVELIPPRSDDDADSPHFPLTPIDMMVEMSRLADKYAMDVSIWFPAMDKDYANPATVEFALKEWGEVFRRLPRVDAVFVPGGDPGHTQPKYLMALLEKQTANLHRYHPKAKMWMSPQSFSKDWMEEFYGIMKSEPKWLTGVVFGPQTMYSLPEMRARIPQRYPIRLYPDITHSMHAQFPVPDWDAAYAATEGREGINPRPTGTSVIFHRYLPLLAGFVSYSEGCNDDVNKIIWSGLGWNPDADIKKLLNEYARFFIGEEFGDSFSEGLFALERNWNGPLAQNESVDATLRRFQDMDRNARPFTRLSWRFQQALYRANYDAFLRTRLAAESKHEQEAIAQLAQAGSIDTVAAMDQAEKILEQDVAAPAGRELRARVFEIAEALFQSVRMQLSVPRYQAIGIGRGANLDAIDYALNDRVWLKNQFAAIRKLSGEGDRVAQIERIVHWIDPGPGGFYDDLGNTSRQPHLLPGEGFAKDPDFLKSPLTGFGSRTAQQGWRVSWFDYAESLYDESLRMRYTNLDANAHYKVRVVYGGDMPQVPVRLVANGSIPIHDYLKKQQPPAPVEFDIPQAATKGGTLELAWNRPPGLGGNGRGCQVSEVWLIRIP